MACARGFRMFSAHFGTGFNPKQPETVPFGRERAHLRSCQSDVLLSALERSLTDLPTFVRSFLRLG